MKQPGSGAGAPALLLRRPLHRRTVLRGLGAALSLPLLEAMAPVARAGNAAAPKRLQVFYTPNGMMMQWFKPATAGRDYALPATLEPLAGMRERFTVVTGLASNKAVGGGGHGRSCPAFLTGATPRQTQGSDLYCGVSMDQVAAAHIGDTPLPSLELGIDPPSLLGSCDVGYSCTYTNTLSWRDATSALPVVVNPRDVFERMFGDGDSLDAASRMAQLRRRSSILDFVREDAARLAGRLGTHDRQKMEQYLDAVRSIEKRIRRAGAGEATGLPADFTRPAGIPANFEEHARLMTDLLVLAAQADITRVGTFMLGRELSNRTYPEIGVTDAHHMLSHHGGDPEKQARIQRINAYHMGFLAYYLGRLAATPEGDGSLLDSTIVLAGCAFGEPNDHDNLDLPVIVAGGGLPGGRHLAVPRLTPVANLHLALLQRLGVPVEQFGDSTRPLTEILVS